MEQFFSSGCIRDEAKVKMAMLHLEGKALNWHHFFVQRRGGLPQLSWEVYARGLQECFCFDTLLDPMFELVTLKQLGSVTQFHDTFVILLNQIDLTEEHAISVFVNNLKPEIGQYLRLFLPSTLTDGFRLARRVENIISGPVKKLTYIGGTRGLTRPLLPNIKPVQAVPFFSTMEAHKGPMKSLSQVEMDDQRHKGLFFWCASKYSPSHKCQKSQLYQLVINVSSGGEAEPNSPNTDEFQDCKEQ